MENALQRHSVKLMFILFCTLASCASDQSKWIDKNCNEESAYRQGSDDARNNKRNDVDRYALFCERNEKDEIAREYRKGFAEYSVEAKKNQDQPHHWFCEVSTFNDHFESYATTEAEAKRIAIQKCSAESAEAHCKAVTCTLVH